MDTRFSRNDNLAPFFDSSKQKKTEVSRSAFDFGRSHSFQLKFGMLSVADCFPTLPNSNYKLSCNLNAIFRNPTVRKLVNNCRLFVEYFYCREGDLWEGAHNTITKGRSGSINKDYPSLKFSHVPTGSGNIEDNFFAFDTPDSLLDDFGLPCTHSHSRSLSPDLPNYVSPLNSHLPLIDVESTGFNQIGNDLGLEDNDSLYINALPFFMYQKVWRDFYLNKNLSYQNKNILPDNEEHFIIPYDADSVLYLDYSKPLLSSQLSSIANLTSQNFKRQFYDVNMSDDSTPLFIAQKRYRQWRGDYFMTAFPFPEGIRGDVPTLDLSLSTDDLSITIPSQRIAVQGGAVGALSGNTSAKLYWNGSNFALTTTSGVSSGAQIGSLGQNITIPSQDVSIPESFSTSITLNDIRQLEAFTKFQEKMARTDGDYSDMIKAQFGSSTIKTSRQPIYIGGFYQDILVNSVFQTSQSSSDSPLGRQSGIGVSSGEHYIGDFYSDDYGYIMAVISCVPEVYYNTGIDRLFSQRSMSDKYFPLMNDLPPQPILNKELFVSGDSSIDEDVFAYAERFSEYKSRRNLITGKGRFYRFTDDEGNTLENPIPYDEYDNARVIIRNLSNTPNFNNDFVQATDVDMNSFSVRDEMPLDIDFGSKVVAVLPMPYITVPGGLDEN